MRRTRNEGHYQNLVGWMSTPQEHTLTTDLDRTIFRMSRAAATAVIKTAFSTEKGNRCLWRPERTDDQMFGTLPTDNQFDWRPLSADRLTRPRLLSEITGRLNEGALIYNDEMSRVYRDLGAFVAGQDIPPSAAFIHVDTFGLSLPYEYFKPEDRRSE